MGELSPQSQHCNPAQGRRSSGGQDPGAKTTKEGRVLLTSEAEKFKIQPTDCPTDVFQSREKKTNSLLSIIRRGHAPYLTPDK